MLAQKLAVGCLPYLSLYISVLLGPKSTSNRLKTVLQMQL